MPSRRNWTPDTPTLSDAVAETVTEEPETVKPLVGAVRETVGKVMSKGALTVRENIVVFVIPPVPVTVTVYVPAGVEAVVFMVSVVEQVGLQEVGE